MKNSKFNFHRNHVFKAIKKTDEKGLSWLYQNYPAPGGRIVQSKTGFLYYNKEEYPIKPLGRLANELASRTLQNNPTTNHFRRYFKKLGFTTEIPSGNYSTLNKKEKIRRKVLCEILARPQQAKFREEVLNLWGRKCVISDCPCEVALEAAHIVPVGKNGTDNSDNGFPLRADLHQLFDAGHLSINPKTLSVKIDLEVAKYYEEFEGVCLEPKLLDKTKLKNISTNLRKREMKSS